jgi:hypothetical protein
MTGQKHVELRALLDVATLIANRAIADLAEAQSMYADIENRLGALAQSITNQPLVGFDDAVVHTRWLSVCQDKRAQLLEDLSDAHSVRKPLLAIARKAEGKRQALQELFDQVS